jgi:hypothetical protein
MHVNQMIYCLRFEIIFIQYAFTTENENSTQIRKTPYQILTLKLFFLLALFDVIFHF